MSDRSLANQKARRRNALHKFLRKFCEMIRSINVGVNWFPDGIFIIEIIVNTNSNNLEPEFEARLKAHIKMQSDITVCEGFDFDTASAYLEHTLQAKASTLYEEHLAACAACRSQVVELSRLKPAENVVASAVAPVRAKWSEWFSGWKLGMLAGLGTATAAILLFATVTMQRNTALQTVAKSNEATAPVTAEPLANDKFVELKESAKQDGAKTANPAPSASVMAEAAAQGAAAKVAAPIAEDTKKSIQRAEDNLAKVTPAPVVIAPSVVSAESKDAPLQNAPQGQLQNSQWLPRPLPTPTPHGPSYSQNQMQNVQVLPAESAKLSAPASAVKREELQTEKIRERAKQKIADAEKGERDDRTERSATTVSAAGRAAKATAEKNVAGKNFRFENGRWVDTQLNSGMTEIRLKRNSDDYKKVLKDTPGLKPYFDLKAVTVVWEGKAYRVE